MREEIKKSLYFTIFVLLISYILGFSIYFLKNRIVFSQTFFSIFSIIYMYIPFFTVVLVEKYIFKGSLKGLGLYLKWDRFLLLAIILPIILTFSSIFSSLIFKDITLNKEYLKIYFLILIIIQAIIFGSTINALVALGEEVGWRGYLVNNLIHIGFYKSSIIIGFIWGIWHAPLILMGHNYPLHSEIGVIMMVIFCILLTPIMIYLTLKSKSVIIPSIFHGVLNAIAGLPLYVLNGGDDLTKGLGGFGGFIVLIILNIILFPYIKRLDIKKDYQTQ